MLAGVSLAVVVILALAATLSFASEGSTPANINGDAAGNAATIAIEPSAPTEADLIQITITGVLPVPCYHVKSGHSVSDNVIEIIVSAQSLGGICVQVIWFYEVTEEIGSLPAGTYTVEAHVPCFWYQPPCVDAAEFTVRPAATVSPTSTPTPTATSTSSPVPTATPTMSITRSPTPSSTATSTPSPSPTNTSKDPNGDTDGDTIPNSSDPDDDNDGCTDLQELGADETLGGRRNPHNPWDFYDTNGDGVIDLFTDIFDVIQHFSLDGSPPYDVTYDRGPSAGPNPWNMTAPDGSIDLLNDVLGVIAQHGHDCR